jgi:hypothetical protein
MTDHPQDTPLALTDDEARVYGRLHLDEPLERLDDRDVDTIRLAFERLGRGLPLSVQFTPEGRRDAAARILDGLLAQDATRLGGPPLDSLLTADLRNAAETLEVLDRLVPRVEPDQPDEQALLAGEVAELRAAALELLTTADDEGIQREHFAGRLYALLGPLDRLGRAVGYLGATE